MDFIKAYEEVFDENGNIKVCGRNACKNLISIAEMTDPATNYGNKNTGFINTENMKKLYESIKERNY